MNPKGFLSSIPRLIILPFELLITLVLSILFNKRKTALCTNKPFQYGVLACIVSLLLLAISQSTETLYLLFSGFAILVGCMICYLEIREHIILKIITRIVMSFLPAVLAIFLIPVFGSGIHTETTKYLLAMPLVFHLILIFSVTPWETAKKSENARNNNYHRVYIPHR